MTIGPLKECIVILNPAHKYGEYLALACARHKELSTVALFTMDWRWNSFKTNFSELGDIFDETIYCYQTTDEEKIAHFSAWLKQKGLIPKAVVPWDDPSVFFGGKLSEHYSLPWLKYQEAQLYKNKHKLKLFIKEKTDLRVNRFCVTGTAAGATKFQQQIGNWPVILKPLNAGGSWNVYRAYNDEEIDLYTNRILSSYNDFDKLENSKILVEEFISGDEFAVNGLTDQDGRILITDIFKYIFDPKDKINHVRLESQYVNPADQDVRKSVDYVANVISSLGLCNSPFHFELRIDERGPCIIEVSCRLAGNMQPLAQEITGNDHFFMAIECYLGRLIFKKKLDMLLPTSCRYGCVVYGISSKAGIVRAVHGKKTLKMIPSYREFIYLPQRGEKLEKTINLDTASYILWAANNDKSVLEKDTNDIREIIQIDFYKAPYGAKKRRNIR